MFQSITDFFDAALSPSLNNDPDAAEHALRLATDLFAFTSRISGHFDMPQKVHRVEHLWRVAYADGHLSDPERDVLWRVADLLRLKRFQPHFPCPCPACAQVCPQLRRIRTLMISRCRH